MPSRKVVIGSVGRRVYLVRWFEQALRSLGISGEIHVTDADPHSAGMSIASFAHVLPRYEEPDYETEMERLFDEVQPDLFFTVNDFELQRLAVGGLATRLQASGAIVLSLAPDLHRAVHDKHEMFLQLSALGIDTPKTALFSDSAGVRAIAEETSSVVIKDRYGSGSSGLTTLASEVFLDRYQSWFARKVATGMCSDQRVIQPAIAGREYGIDVVAPLVPDAHQVTVLVREKLRMRAGETDQAKSVESGPLQGVGERLAGWLRHRGLIDSDVIVDSAGTPHVIDINPRFGGGYPFNHLAGANIPGLYLAQLCGVGRDELTGFLRYEPAIRVSKFEDVVVARDAEASPGSTAASTHGEI